MTWKQWIDWSVAKQRRLGVLARDAGFDAAVGNEPDDGDDYEAECGDPRADEGQRNRRNVNGDGEFAFAVAANGLSQSGGLAMQSEEGPDEDVVGDGSEEEDDSVEGDGPRGEMIVPHPCGGEGNKRKPEEEMKIGPEGGSVDVLNSVEQVMMIAPVNANEYEAEDVAEKNWKDRAKRFERAAAWRFHLEDHDGDDDGEDAVAEGFEAVFGHGLPFA